MSKFSVTMNIAGQITIQVNAANEQEAYDNAVDAFFDALKPMVKVPPRQANWNWASPLSNQAMGVPPPS